MWVAQYRGDTGGAVLILEEFACKRAALGWRPHDVTGGAVGGQGGAEQRLKRRAIFGGGVFR